MACTVTDVDVEDKLLDACTCKYQNGAVYASDAKSLGVNWYIVLDVNCLVKLFDVPSV